MLNKIKEYLVPGAAIYDVGNYLFCPIENASEGLVANAYYFSHPAWAEEYLTYCHRSEEFKSRWEAAIGNWDNKVVLDIGCGPGNLLATLGGKPKVIIGVDVAEGSLKLAKELGYVPLLADATNLPFVSGFADIVTLNATLHHCDDMEAILKEAARLVKPNGGILVTDHDPQKSAWNFKGVGKLMWNGRLILYRMMQKGFHKGGGQQEWGLKCEIHHRAGDGVTRDLFHNVLQKDTFDVAIYPHNHTVGKEVLQGVKGKAEFKYRLGNLLSGRNPSSDASALSLMCVARRKN
ncbi:class I SAM-dependent methyltransferase [Paraflavisolibacter sp. H34]|uniref:class I SAM-dependent methyltransferase n=1 Tax=Huijunlia imazamoxiresistens TaxID=3127457 RepID=UPI003018E533